MNQKLSLTERSKERCPSITAAAAQLCIPKEAIKLAIHRGCDCIMSNRTVKVAPLIYSLIEIQVGEISDEDRGGPYDWSRVLKPNECFRGNRSAAWEPWGEYEFQISRLVHGDGALGSVREAVIDMATKAAKAEASLTKSRLASEKRIRKGGDENFFPLPPLQIEIPLMDMKQPPTKALSWAALYLWACDEQYHDSVFTETTEDWPKELRWSQEDPRWPDDRDKHRPSSYYNRLRPISSILE